MTLSLAVGASAALRVPSLADGGPSTTKLVVTKQGGVFSLVLLLRVLLLQCCCCSVRTSEMVTLNRCAFLALLFLVLWGSPSQARTLGGHLLSGPEFSRPGYVSLRSKGIALSATGGRVMRLGSFNATSSLPAACFLWLSRQKQKQQEKKPKPFKLWGSYGVARKRQEVEKRGPGGPSCSSGVSRGFRLLPERSAAYAVLSIPVEVALHPAAHGAIMHAAKLLQRMELLVLLMGSAAATALALAVAVPRLIIFRGGADLLLLPASGLIMLPFLLLLFAYRC